MLQCARSVSSQLGIPPAEVPVEGYYYEDEELTEYFKLIRAFQDVPLESQGGLSDPAGLQRLTEVTSSGLYGVPKETAEPSLLPKCVDVLTSAMDDIPMSQWSISTLVERSGFIAARSDEFSLVALAALSGDPLVLCALRESVVLYALALGGSAMIEPPPIEYVWRVDPEIESRARRFVSTFNRLFSEALPEPTEANAERYWDDSVYLGIIGRCVRIGYDDRPRPYRQYHWAIGQGTVLNPVVEEFWDDRLWTTEMFREKLGSV